MLRKIKRLPAEQLILLVLGLSLVFLVLWLLGIGLTWGLLTLLGVQGDLWSALEGISSAASFAITIAGGLVLLVQLNEAIESRNLDIYNDAFERMMDDANIEARRWIYLNLPDDVEEGLALLDRDPVGHTCVKRVLNSFDHLGFLLQQDWGVSEPVVKWVSPFVVKTWAKLEPYVDHEAQRRGEPDYYEAARYLAQRCREWRAKNVSEGKVAWVDRAM